MRIFKINLKLVLFVAAACSGMFQPVQATYEAVMDRVTWESDSYDGGTSGDDSNAGLVIVSVLAAPIWVPLAAVATVVVGPPYGIYKAGKGIYKYVKRKREASRLRARYEEFLDSMNTMVELLNSQKSYIKQECQNRQVIVTTRSEFHDDLAQGAQEAFTTYERKNFSLSYMTHATYEFDEESEQVIVHLNSIKHKAKMSDQNGDRTYRADKQIEWDVQVGAHYLLASFEQRSFEGLPEFSRFLERVTDCLTSSIALHILEDNRSNEGPQESYRIETYVGA